MICNIYMGIKGHTWVLRGIKRDRYTGVCECLSKYLIFKYIIITGYLKHLTFHHGSWTHSHPPWSLSRITGKDLDSGKHWYVLTSSLCGVKPNKFAQNENFRCFPEEIRSVPLADLKPGKRGFSFNMQPTKLFYVCLFGLLSLPYFDSVILVQLGLWDHLNLFLLGIRSIESL